MTTLIQLPEFRDERGALCFAETPGHFPFEVRRVFYLYDLPPAGHRGGHAHRTCHQVLICLSGALGLAVGSPAGEEEFVLDSPRRALHLPPLSWVDITILKPGTICLVLTSHAYDPADYINDRAEFDALCR
ncbi:MAG: WxcM-like domain-containing protein [Magnetospirillum sp.]|nr:MAG: WxcM-like domain-containing protein [Magnetospirillum sp.]